MKEIIEGCDHVLIVPFLPKKALEVLAIWCLSPMKPSWILISNIDGDYWVRDILQIRHDLPILIRCRPANKECYIPSSLFSDGLSPYGKGVRQTVDRTTA